MKRPFLTLWGRIGIVCLAYAVTAGMVLSQAVSHGFVLMVLLLPLAVTALAFGPLAGAGFGLITGMLAAVLSLLTAATVPLLDNPMVSVMFYMGAGAVLGCLHPWSQGRSKEVLQQEAWERAWDIQLKLDAKGNVLARNVRASNVLGNVQHLFDVVHPEEKERAREQLEYAYTRDETRWPVRVVGLNQQVFPVEAQMIRDGESLSLELHDLSELYKIERQLSETEARYRVLIEDAIASLDAGIVVLDRNRQVLWANEALAHMLGLDQEWLVGRDLDRILEKAADRFLSPEVPKQIAQPSASATNLTIAIQNGKGCRIFDYNSIPISTERYQGGRIDYFYDITDNKQLEESLLRQTEQLKAINERLEAFTHVVSHDLKEPLRSLEMFSSYLLEDYEALLDEEGKDYLQSIVRAAKRMKGLIDDLLDLASIGRRNEPKELVDLNQALKDVLHDLEASLVGVRVFQPKEALPDVCVNRTRIEQLFANLISNGVKYNDKQDKRVEVGWERKGKGFEFWVKDNGIGIEQEYIKSRIFELFERLNPQHDNYEGTGAGLAICKRVVEEYGGKIWAESKVGEGSTFYFTLPEPNTKVVNHHEAAENLVG